MQCNPPTRNSKQPGANTRKSLANVMHTFAGGSWEEVVEKAKAQPGPLHRMFLIELLALFMIMPDQIQLGVILMGHQIQPTGIESFAFPFYQCKWKPRLGYSHLSFP